MTRAETFRNASLGLALLSTGLYWSIHVYHTRTTEERRAVLSATALPLALNGLKPSLRGVVEATATAASTQPATPGRPGLILVVNDSCAGCGVAVPQWGDWIRSSPRNNYSAVLVSTGGTNYVRQLADALASRGVENKTLQVTRRPEWIFSSAVSGTPTLLAVDTLGRVRLVLGTLTEPTRQLLDEFLRLEQKATSDDTGA